MNATRNIAELSINTWAGLKSRPILFSAPMVRALLDGSKTQTRRVVKPRHLKFFDQSAADMLGQWNKRPFPYGQPGDRLWVRESWRIGAWCEDDGALAIDYLASEPEKTPWIIVPEDAEKYHGGSVFEKYWIQSTDDCIESKLSTDDKGAYHWTPGQSPCRKRPSIHMPRWASRITLEITGVRVERLQDISDDDCISEGIGLNQCAAGVKTTGIEESLPRGMYHALWDGINRRSSWDANPWVWVIEFKVLKGGAA